MPRALQVRQASLCKVSQRGKIRIFNLIQVKRSFSVFQQNSRYKYRWYYRVWTVKFVKYVKLVDVDDTVHIT